MGAVTLRAIDRDNWETCIQLSVAKDQQSFVASNLYSLAQAFVWPECVSLGIFEEDTMVGFLMWAKDRRDRQYWVYRLMIDHRFQRRGVARRAMRAIMEDLSRQADFQLLRISFEPENAGAATLYRKLGFRETGQVLDGERVLEWTPDGESV